MTHDFESFVATFNSVYIKFCFFFYLTPRSLSLAFVPVNLHKILLNTLLFRPKMYNTLPPFTRNEINSPYSFLSIFPLCLNNVKIHPEYFDTVISTLYFKPVFAISTHYSFLFIYFDLFFFNYL